MYKKYLFTCISILSVAHITGDTNDIDLQQQQAAQILLEKQAKIHIALLAARGMPQELIDRKINEPAFVAALLEKVSGTNPNAINIIIEKGQEAWDQERDAQHQNNAGPYYKETYAATKGTGWTGGLADYPNCMLINKKNEINNEYDLKKEALKALGTLYISEKSPKLSQLHNDMIKDLEKKAQAQNGVIGYINETDDKEALCKTCAKIGEFEEYMLKFLKTNEELAWKNGLPVINQDLQILVGDYLEHVKNSIEKKYNLCYHPERLVQNAPKDEPKPQKVTPEQQAEKSQENQQEPQQQDSAQQKQLRNKRKKNYT